MINVALVGPGRMGKNYLAVLAQDARIRIVSVCGNDPDRTKQVAELYSCASYPNGNFQGCLSSPADLVFITTSEWAHEDVLRQALQQKKNIVIEKPFVADWETFKRLAPLVEAYSSVILPCFTSRFDSRYVSAKQKLQNQKPVSIYSRRNTDFKTAARVHGKIPMSSWIICHDVDLLRWFVGRPAQSVRATSKLPGKPLGAKDFIQAEIRFTDGGLGTIENSWVSPPGLPTLHSDFRVITEEGGIELDLLTAENVDFYIEEGQWKGNTPNMIRHFVDVVAERSAPRVNLEDAIENMRICEALRLSLERQEEVFLEEIKL